MQFSIKIIKTLPATYVKDYLYPNSLLITEPRIGPSTDPSPNAPVLMALILFLTWL